MTIIAEIGTSFFEENFINSEDEIVIPNGRILMKEARPDVNYIAAKSVDSKYGAWIEDDELLKQQVLEERDSLLAMAAVKIAPIQDAVDIDEATAAEEEKLKQWKKYRVQLNRIEQQESFPAYVEWPIQPE